MHTDCTILCTTLQRPNTAFGQRLFALLHPRYVRTHARTYVYVPSFRTTRMLPPPTRLHPPSTRLYHHRALRRHHAAQCLRFLCDSIHHTFSVMRASSVSDLRRRLLTRRRFGSGKISSNCCRHEFFNCDRHSRYGATRFLVWYNTPSSMTFM